MRVHVILMYIIVTYILSYCRLDDQIFYQLLSYSFKQGRCIDFCQMKKINQIDIGDSAYRVTIQVVTEQLQSNYLGRQERSSSNTGACLIFTINSREHITMLLRQLHWLHVPDHGLLSRPFPLSYSFLFLVFCYFSIAILSWPSRQLLSARKYIVSYRVTFKTGDTDVPVCQWDCPWITVIRRAMRCQFTWSKTRSAASSLLAIPATRLSSIGNRTFRRHGLLCLEQASPVYQICYVATCFSTPAENSSV